MTSIVLWQSAEELAMIVPMIETERLILRGHRLQDFDELAQMWADPGVTRFIGGKPSTRDESWARLTRYVGHWHLLGYGYWAVDVKDGGRYAGDVGFADWKRDIQPSFDGLPESGWAFTPPAHGKGIATEAVKAVLAWSDRHLSGATTTCIVSPENVASIRVAEKCGYREFARTLFKGSPTIVFRR
jgi:RimJ/RimL family protein N-acetyltransferase